MSQDKVLQEVDQLFKHFHQNPELSYEEYETTAKIEEYLTSKEIEILDLGLETGTVGILGGHTPGPVVALRADIDALPVQEETDLAWKSKVDGKMHACGHDFHTASLLGTAAKLKEVEDQIKGTIKLVFQPAEESSIGALKIIETGVLDDVDVMHGIHVTPVYEVGEIGIKEGALHASVDRFSVSIKGLGTHAGMPHQGRDPLVALVSIVQNLQTLVSRNVNPFEPAVVSVTHIESGSTWNVLPETALFEGTVRTLSPETRKLIKERFWQVVEETAQGLGVEVEINWIDGPPSTNNKEPYVSLANTVADELKLDSVIPSPRMGGEDFAFYQEKIPGIYFVVGTGKSYPNHNPKFQVDPKALPGAVEFYTQLALKTADTWEENK